METPTARADSVERRRRVIVPGSVTGDARRRQGFAFPVMYDLVTFRYNMQLLSSYLIPPQVWADPTFLAEIQAENGSFPVHVWRMRGEEVERVMTVRVPAAQSQLVQFRLSPDVFSKDDVAIIEFTPGILAYPGEAGVFKVPFGSLIDNRTNDAVITYPVMVEF